MRDAGTINLLQAHAPWRASLRFAALFWLCVYAVLSLRAGLADELAALLSYKRLLATGIGTLVYLAALVRVIDRRRAARNGRLRALVILLLPAAAIVLATRLFFDLVLHSQVLDIGNDLRWTLVWTGYFAAWTAAYMLYGEQRTAARPDTQAPSAPTPDASASAPPPAFWVQRGGVSVRITADAIERFEAEGNYVRIHADDGATGFERLALRRLEADLDADRFIRVHRSSLCRLDAIAGLKRHAGGLVLVMASGAEVAVGRSFARQVLERLGG